MPRQGVWKLGLFGALGVANRARVGQANPFGCAQDACEVHSTALRFPVRLRWRCAQGDFVGCNQDACEVHSTALRFAQDARGDWV
jgi:hypothetical protein